MSEPMPLGIAHCCRDWIIALGYPIGRCGLCGDRPEYVEALPEDQWLTPRPPIDERGSR